MEFLRDFRCAARNARRNPGFAAAVVVTLSLGIGAATAIWSLADAVLLAPRPFAEPERLVAIWGEVPGRMPTVEISAADCERWRESATAFSDLALVTAAVADSVLGGSGGEPPTQVRGRVISGNLFDVLGVRPALGRTLTRKDDLAGAEPVLVISDGLWRRRFEGDRKVLGRQVRLDGEAATIVGVLPPGFDYPEGTEVWSSMSWVNAQPELLKLRIFEAIGLMKPGISFDAARADLLAVSAAACERKAPEVVPQAPDPTPVTDAAADTAATSPTLKAVKARGVLRCGVNPGLAGFAAPDGAGRWRGFDVDLCRAGDMGPVADDVDAILRHAQIGDDPTLEAVVDDGHAVGSLQDAGLESPHHLSAAPG